MLHPQFLGESRYRERFAAEAQIIAGLRHSHLVPLYDFGTYGGQPYLVMEQVAGQSLETLLQTNQIPPLEFRRTAEMVRKLAEALQYAHERGIIHLDVKPRNILLDERGEPQLTDFGLASSGAREPGAESAPGNGYEVIGTLPYMSPEQSVGRPVDARSDVYSLGVVLYRMLTGRKLFEGPAETVRQQIIEQQPVPPSELVPRIPADLQTICLKALAKSPESRYQSAGQMADELRRWLDDLPLAVTPPRWTIRARRWCQRNRLLCAFMGNSALLLLATIGTLLLSYMRGRENQISRGAREETRMQALLVEGRELLRSGVAGRTKTVSENLLEELADCRKKLLPDAPAEQFDLEIRALLVAALGEIDLQLVSRTELPGISPNLPWPVALHPSGQELAVAASDRPYRVVPGKPAGFPANATNRRPQPRVAYSYDGHYLAYAPASGGLELWNESITQRQAAWRSGEGPFVVCMAFSPPAAELRDAPVTIRICCGDGTVASAPLDDLEQLNHNQTLAAWPESPTAAAFSADAAYVAIGDKRGHIVIHDMYGKLSREIRGEPYPIEALAWSPESNRLAVGLRGGRVAIHEFSPRDGSLLVVTGLDMIQGLCWSPDGRWIATGDSSTQGVWDAKSGRKVVANPFGAPQGFARDSRRFAVSGQADSAICELLLPRANRALTGLAGNVAQIRWSADESHLVALDSRFEMRVWNATSGRQVARVVSEDADVYALNVGIALDERGRQLAISHAVVGAESRFRIIDVATSMTIGEWRLPFGIDCLASVGDGWFRLVREEKSNPTDEWTSQTVVREYAVGREPRKHIVVRSALPGEKSFFMQSLSDDGRIYFWTGPRRPGEMARAEIWDLASRTRLWHEDTPYQYGANAGEPHGRLRRDGKELWHAGERIDLSRGNSIESAPSPHAPLALSTDGGWSVEFNESGGSISSRYPFQLRDRRRDNRTWLLLSTRDGAIPSSECVSFSPHSRYLAWGSRSGEVTLVDLPLLNSQIKQFEQRYGFDWSE
ncbi:MAG: hypothetical protein EXS05_05365 [Planctomycetaceae bacterium]|nr:hypothetical protein [Planctomycetaceae bacterium]